MTKEAYGVGCRDGCGAFLEFPETTTTDEAAAELTLAGWLFLPSVSRWRCKACVERLDTVTAALSADPNFADKLDPRSRGALPRNTATTILPPVNVATQDNSKLEWE